MMFGILLAIIASGSHVMPATTEKLTTEKLATSGSKTPSPRATTAFGLKAKRRNDNGLPSTMSPTIHYSEVSEIYKKLLLTYDKKFRPFYGEKPVNVSLECHVLSFGDINEVEMEYTVDLYFLQLWFDPRFNVSDRRFENARVELIGPQLQDLWLPDTIFVNSKRSRFHAITIDNRFLTIYLGSGMIAYHSRITMTASCKMDLRSYPFDTQSCKLAIESYGHDMGEIEYNWWKSPDCTSKCDQVHIYDKDMANFQIVEAKKTKDPTVYHAENFSKATTSFVFRRRRQYFVFRIYIPSILIVMVSWSTFWISQAAVPARAGICITTILTLITMLGVVNNNMPKVSYIKAIDLYLLVSFIFVFASLVEYIIVLNFNDCYIRKKKKEKHNTDRDESDPSQNNGNFKAKFDEDDPEKQLFTQFRMKNTCTYRHSVESPNHEKAKPSKEDKIMKKLRKIKNTWQQPTKQPPTHLVDIVARFLFPFTFGIFNFVYWWTQLK